ncbi:MAG: HNH endonuclease signature motif containing protein [Candidatus Methanoperedens sp.]|nr:HNH endonuclease signature motif containing protein [Candidatus Methanoperedens sp.]
MIKRKNFGEKMGVDEILYSELAKDKFHSFEELNSQWNKLKFLEKHYRKEAIIPALWLFESILHKCRTPYSARFLETKRAIINLLNIHPPLKKLIKDDGQNMIGNMVLERGKTKFEILDRYCLDLVLDMFNKALDEKYEADDIFQAILAKKSTDKIIEKKDFKRLHNLLKTFPDKIEFLRVKIPEKTLEELELHYHENISNDIKIDVDENFDIMAQISEEDKKTVSLPQKRNTNVNAYSRNQKLAELIKQWREYKCQVCGKKIPKIDGSFYIETHHIIPLSKGGKDNSSNLVTLCPNHHVMMHFCLPMEKISTTSSEIRFSIDGYDVRIER